MSITIGKKLWGIWYRRQWWLAVMMRIFFPEQQLAKRRWNRMIEESVIRFWRHFPHYSTVMRPLNEQEWVKLKDYEHKYTNIRVYVFDNNLPMGGLGINMARLLENLEKDNDSNICEVIFYQGMIEGEAFAVNAYLFEKIQTLRATITKETYPFWRMYLMRNRNRVSVITTVYYLKQDYEEAIRFFQTGEKKEHYISDIFSKAEIRKGQKSIKDIGIVEPYICIFARDRRYNTEVRCGGSAMYDLRNSDINAFSKTTKYFWEKNIQSVRMGASVESEYCCEGAVDYANHGRTDFLDAFIFGRCFFSIGDPSGISAFAYLLNFPWVLINMQQILTFGDHGQDFALGIYLKYYDPRRNRYLRLREIAELQIKFHSLIEMPTLENDMLPYDDYVHEHYEIVHNTPEEILDVAKEMEEILNDTVQYTVHDEELQQRYRNQIYRFLSMYPVKICPFICRIGRQWLRDNEWFLE